MGRLITRRNMIATAGIAGGGLLLSRLDPLASSPTWATLLDRAEVLTRDFQEALLTPGQLAREYTQADISPVFKANGTIAPDSATYARHVAENFANWRLRVDGMVSRPLSLSLADIRKLPSRTQITRHDCVEGWSAIAQWSGAPLAGILDLAGVYADAKFTVLYCADNLEGDDQKGGERSPGRYYESHEIGESFHPQTILAYSMNGQPLDIAHGAPLRLRLERQLGYKHAKYVERIQITNSFADIHGGRGGYWEDRGYEWYAGI